MQLKTIIIEAHALYRLMQRGLRYNLTFPESEKRVFETFKKGKEAQKHCSRKHKTKCLYFNDNLTFYIVFAESKKEIRIKTVIIEEGRE
jgi:hypothetical protein